MRFAFQAIYYEVLRYKIYKPLTVRSGVSGIDWKNCFWTVKAGNLYSLRKKDKKPDQFEGDAFLSEVRIKFYNNDSVTSMGQNG